MSIKEQVSLPSQRVCTRCNFVSSQAVCKACVLLEGLNKGLPKLGIGKSSKVKRILAEYDQKQTQENAPNGNLEDALKDLNADKESQLPNGSKFKSKKKQENVLKENNKCNKKNCCSAKSNTEEPVENSKINSLLEQYGLDETSNERIDEDLEESIENGDDLLINDDEDTCGGSCGKMGSLQIGF